MTPQPLKSAARHARTLAIVVALSVVIIAAFWTVGTSAADPTVSAVQTLAVDTIQIEHKALVPAVARGAAVSKAEGDRLRASAESLARSHYTGALLASRLTAFRQAIDDQVGGKAVYLDGGVKDVVQQSTRIGIDNATVKLRATTWMKVSQGSVEATPIGTADYTFELVKVDGTWLVTSEAFDYLPGQGP
jgi:hypothetical protein